MRMDDTPNGMNNTAGATNGTATNGTATDRSVDKSVDSGPVGEALRFADSFFQRRLAEQDGDSGAHQHRAHQYLLRRGYGKSVIDDYGLGWAPDSWDALLGAATAEGFSREVLVEAGLIKPRTSSGHYDRFRGRLIFPLYPRRGISPDGGPQDGIPLGFAGRRLSKTDLPGEENSDADEPGDEDAPKYINSPETERYHKEEYLYGLWRAAPSIEAVGTAIVTEGYTDVITLQQEGIGNVVASSGTALTKAQAAMISSVADTAAFAYDPDTAGVRAAIRGMKRAVAAGLAPKAAVLPEGLDPHEFCRSRGLRETRSHLEKRVGGLAPLLKWASERGIYGPEPSVLGEVRQAAGKAPTEALRQSLLLEASRHLPASDRELFSGGRASGSIN
jgi:DNA primase